MVIYLHIVYSHYLSNDAELSSHNRDHRVAHKAKNNHYLVLTEKVCWLLFIITLGYILTI